MAAATAVIFDPSDLDVVEGRLRELQAKHQQLLTTVTGLRDDNRALSRRNRELEREIMVTRLDSGELSPPAAIGDAFAAEVWLAWARRNHHTDACACHRCYAARMVLGG